MIELTEEEAYELRKAIESRRRHMGYGTREHNVCLEILSKLFLAGEKAEAAEDARKSHEDRHPVVAH